MQAFLSYGSNSLFAVDGYYHAVVPYLCFSPSALLDSSAGQGGGSHKTREKPGEDVADPKGNEFLRERLNDNGATNIIFSRPSPSV